MRTTDIPRRTALTHLRLAGPSSHRLASTVAAVAALSLLCAGNVLGQRDVGATAHKPLELPDVHVVTLPSKITGATYDLYVRVPDSFATDAKRTYPVIYLLDADYSFLIARNITQHLSDRNHLPETLLVGIAYAGEPAYRRNRTRDYTPTHVPTGGYGPEMQRYSGGGPKFRAFIERELIPFVDAHYPATPGDRTLVGHSYGGLFTFWVALTRPDLFRRYLPVSPSLWYDDHLPLRVEAAYSAKHRELPIKIYTAVGSREINSERNMVTDLGAMVETLRSRHYRGLELRDQVWQDETHNSIFPLALSTGLRWLLDGR